MKWNLRIEWGCAANSCVREYEIRTWEAGRMREEGMKGMEGEDQSTWHQLLESLDSSRKLFFRMGSALQKSSSRQSQCIENRRQGYSRMFIHPSTHQATVCPMFFFYVQFTRFISFAATPQPPPGRDWEEKLIPRKVCVKTINTQGIEETISWQSKHLAGPEEGCLHAICQSLSYATPRCARLPISFWGMHHPMTNLTPVSA